MIKRFRSFLVLLALSCVSILSAQTLTSVGPMILPRAGHTSTLMQDGTVLIAGGVGAGNGNNYQLQQNEEIYTPGVGFGLTVGSLQNPRQGASAFLANNGNVAIIGGVNLSGGAINNIEIYDHVGETFSIVKSLPAAPDGSIQLADGTILIFYQNSSATSIFDPVAITLNSGINDLSVASNRYLFKQADGSILVMVLGQTSRVYTAATSGPTFTSIGSPVASNAVPSFAVGTMMANGNVLFSGGLASGNTGSSATEIWSSSTGFQPGPTMSSPRFYHSAMSLLDGTVLIIGGDVYSGSGSPFGTGHNETASIDIYNPSNNTINPAPNLPYTQFGLTTNLLPDGTAFFCGGDSFDQNQNGAGVPLAYTYTYPSAFGGLFPKYIVLGVIYSPPGSKSSALYSTSDTIGTASNISSAFQSATTIGASVSGSVAPGTQPGTPPAPAPGQPSSGTNAPGNKGITSATGTAGVSQNWSQQNNTSDSVSLTTTTSNGLAAVLSATASVGVDHDYDTILVWLNPKVLLSTGVLPNFATWRGYQINGEDTLFPDELDVVQITVLCLKAPYIQDCQAPAARFAKAWDTSGLGGLTNDDFQSILAADPFATDPNYDPAADPHHRFDVQAGLSANYVPTPAGSTPTGAPQVYSRTLTTTEGKGATDIHQTGFTVSGALTGFLTFNAAHTMMWTNTWSTTETQTNTFNASVTIVPPAFSDNYPQSSPTGFQVYKDNVYGTFMWFAPTYPAYRSTDPGSILLSPNSVSFTPITAAGGTSSPVLITVTNNSAYSITMDNRISFSTPSFSVQSGTDQCSGHIVVSQGSCTFFAQFTPKKSDAVGGVAGVSGTMYVSGLTIATIFATAPLGGTAKPAFSHTAPIDFGSQPFQNISTTVPVTFTNESNASISLGYPAYIFSDPSFVADTANDTCSGASLGAGQSCTVLVYFSPYALDITSVGNTLIAGNITLTSDAGDSTVALQGTAMVTTLGTASVGSVYISGQEQSTISCFYPPPPAPQNQYCYPTSWDEGAVTLAILKLDSNYNLSYIATYPGYYSYGMGPDDIAAGIIAAVNADPTAIVSASSGGYGIVNLVSKGAGVVTNYIVTGGVGQNYPTPSFSASFNGMFGGTDPRY